MRLSGTSGKGKFSGWLRSIWSRRGLTVQELKSVSASDLRNRLGSGFSNAGAAFELTLENLARQYLTTAETASAMAYQLKLEIGRLQVRSRNPDDRDLLTALESARAASALKLAASLYAEIARSLSQLSLELSGVSAERLRKSPQSKPQHGAQDSKSVPPKHLSNSPHWGA